MLLESAMISAEWVIPPSGRTVEEGAREANEGAGDLKGLEYWGEMGRW
jgi:hypothetical protein